MTPSTDHSDVVDVHTESRFVVRLGGHEAELVYHLNGDRLVLVHTEVPDEMSGHGIGGRLVSAAIARAKSEHLTVVPWCPFARRWLRDHRDVAARVDIDWHSQAPAG